MIIRYDSTAALRNDYVKLHGEPRQAQQRKRTRFGDDDWRPSDSWYGNESEADSCRLALSGDTKLVPEAEALLSELDTAIETPRKTWARAPAGAYCVVPEFLAGIPTHMRRMEQSADERAPITILVTTTSSAGIDAETLRKRGTVILALVMALTRVRPVSLQQLTVLDGRRDGTGETIITSTINTNPLDLATACYVLTSAGFARRLTYGLGRKHNDFMGGWPRGFAYGNPTPYYERVKKLLVAEPDKCLVIGAAQLGDELLKTPVAWIQKQIARFTQQQEEEVL